MNGATLAPGAEHLRRREGAERRRARGQVAEAGRVDLRVERLRAGPESSVAALERRLVDVDPAHDQCREAGEAARRGRARSTARPARRDGSRGASAKRPAELQLRRPLPRQRCGPERRVPALRVAGDHDLLADLRVQLASGARPCRASRGLPRRRSGTGAPRRAEPLEVRAHDRVARLQPRVEQRLS